VASAPKLQRLTDLLAALLRRRFPVKFDVLRQEVPGYAAHAGPVASLMRKFERDKDELRAFGVPIETITGADGNLSEYRLASRNFYLPYLQLTTDRRQRKRRKGIGYQGLPTLAFEPDELAAILRAARRVQTLGDPALAREAATALRKIAHDLPVDTVSDSTELFVSERGLDAGIFDELARAVRSRKKVTFTYYSMRRDERSSRRVDPYGIAYVSSNWYLIGHDHDAGGVRQFRARRISDLEVNEREPQSRDFSVPSTFDLWEYTKSRQAWELGDAEARTVVVRFSESGGHVAQAMRLGATVAGDPTVRGFRVRRVDSFLRWVLGFAGAARPVDPPEVVEEYEALVRATLSIHE
jgi:proteasome accessory factor B